MSLRTSRLHIRLARTDQLMLLATTQLVLSDFGQATTLVAHALLLTGRLRHSQ